MNTATETPTAEPIVQPNEVLQAAYDLLGEAESVAFMHRKKKYTLGDIDLPPKIAYDYFCVELKDRLGL